MPGMPPPPPTPWHGVLFPIDAPCQVGLDHLAKIARYKRNNVNTIRGDCCEKLP
jgi:hypothetical protein